jgi:chromate transporter
VSDSSNPPEAQRGSLREIAGFFLWLGFTAFGGPAAHLALMEDQLVRRRKWLDRQHFLDLLSAISFIPGPNSTEMAIALGRLRGGLRGLLVAGFCFILPAVLIILPIAWIYVRFHEVHRFAGAMRGIGAAVVAIVAAAVWRFARTCIRDLPGLAIALAAMLAEYFSQRGGFGFGDVLILLCAACAGAMRAPRRSITAASIAAWPLGVVMGFVSFSGPLLMALLFLKIGFTLFGSGYVLTSYLQTSFVNDRHWLTQQQVIDAIAVGQVTPGPLLTSATFVGFLLGYDRFGGGLGGGIFCAFLATMAIFAPAFVLIATLSSIIERLRKNPQARAALDGVNAAVVVMIAVACYWMGHESLREPYTIQSAILIAVCLFILLKTRSNPTWLIVGAGIIGAIIQN